MGSMDCPFEVGMDRIEVPFQGLEYRGFSEKLRGFGHDRRIYSDLGLCEVIRSNVHSKKKTATGRE